MNALDDKGHWVDAKAVFEISNEGAVARQTAHKVVLASSPTDPNPVDLTTPDNQRMVSRVLGISYYSPATGQSVMIAEPREVQGKIVGDNQVLYEDCFDGGFKADLSYRLTWQDWNKTWCCGNSRPGLVTKGSISMTSMFVWNC